MHKQKIQFVQGLILIPFLTIGSPLAMLNTVKTPTNGWGGGYFASLSESRGEREAQALAAERAKKIDAYYAKRNMPLEGYGAKMIAEAEKNGLDWRLLPAIAIKESTGGKFACYNNPFGWGSCKIRFDSYDEAIETVARNLGGNNPNTEQYYKGKMTEEKLHHYNNSVVPTYTKEIYEFMELLEATEVVSEKA